MTTLEIIAQVIGALATATFISGFQLKSRAWILIFGISIIIAMIHYDFKKKKTEPECEQRKAP